MELATTDIDGVLRIRLAPREDERGSLVRTFCREFFADNGLCTELVQCSLVRNHARGTLRGLHYQAPPHGEVKVVHCLRGAIFDVVLDLRPGSPTRGRHIALELSAERPELLYVPEGCAHGYQTLEPDTWVHYAMTAAHEPAAERGVRWNDPVLAIAWPLPDPILSDRDRNLPPLPGA